MSPAAASHHGLPTPTLRSRRTRITHPDGQWFNTSYDGLNRPLLLQANGATTIAGNEYSTHGRLWVVNRIGQATEITYDNVQRPYVLHHYLPTAGNVQWVTQFNAAGQVSSTVRTNDAYAWRRHYAINRGYTTNGLNQYSAVGTAPYTYDANGNVTGDGSKTFLYDIENRMVGASGGVTLTYDPLGRLFQIANASTTTQFLYDGDALVGEYNGANELKRRHVHNVGADVPMATYEVTAGTGLGTISQLFADRQGSIVAQLTSGGVNTGLNTYDEYGIPGLANSGRFQYTGQAWLAELGLYYYKARIYSPTLGRFMQTDPIGYADQFNLYAYVGNDPMNGRDPDGRCQTRDNAKECLVTNRAGAAGATAASNLQAQVRQVDHAIRNLDPKEIVKVDTGGGNHRVMTGAQVASAWANTDWAVDPESTTYANGYGAQMDQGRFSGRPSYIESFRNDATAWGRDPDEATRSMVLHDLGHTTVTGQGIMAANSGTSTADFETRERATSRLGQSIGNTIGVTFECRTFNLGC